MEDDIRKIYAPNLVAILIDAQSDRDIAGRLVHLYEARAMSFAGMTDLIIKLDALYDEWKYPQRATMQRSFNAKNTTDTGRRPDAEHLNHKEKVRSIDDLYEERGEIATFILQVEYRQNASWQGNLIRLEEGVTSSFQSVLELMRDMDRALRDLTEEA